MGRVTAQQKNWGFFSRAKKRSRKLVGSGFAYHVVDMRKKSWWILLSLLNLSFCMLMTGCGKGYDEEVDEVRQEEQAIAQFEARLKALNNRVGSNSGHLTIIITDNQFWARMAFGGPFTGQMSSQYIHSGSRCPTIQDDRNKDGYVDFMEAHDVVGDIIIPLDSVLESQLRGMNLFPKIKKNKSYYYSEATNYSRMMEDLRREDIFVDDKIRKLDRDEEIDLSRRVVMVYGVAEDRKLPLTIASYDGYPPQASLPVACGEIFEIF